MNESLKPIAPPLPNLIMPGGQKCGSTSLAYYLSRHPDCLMSNPKEPHFFSRKGDLDIEQYRRCFRGYDGESVIGEASTDYLIVDYAADRIHAHLGTPKILIILRNPVARTVSAYLHLKKRLHDFRSLPEVLGDLPNDPEEAFAEEGRRLAAAIQAGDVDYQNYNKRYDDYLWAFRYVSNSWYLPAVRRYIDIFGRERVHVALLERLERDPQGEMARVCDFLDLEPLSGQVLGVRKNETALRRSVRLLQRTPRTRIGRGLVRAWSVLFPEAATRDRRTELSPDTEIYSRLQSLLRKQVDELAALTGIDLAGVWQL